MAATDARPIPRKNVAYRATFPILDADGDLVTGAATLDSEVSIDGGIFADAVSEATEIATASGMYFLDLTAAEMNGDTVAVIVKTSTAGAKTTSLVFYPEEIGDVRVDVQQFGGVAGTFTAGRPNVETATAVTTVNGLAANVITATSIAADAITAAKVAADVGTEIRSLASGTSDSGTTTTMVDAARTEADTDYWKGQMILFTSGTILGQARLITAFDPATDTITFAPATTAAVGTQTYEILPWSRVDLHFWLGAVVNALVAGRVDSSTGAMAANVLTATAINADAITAAKIADGAIDALTFAAGAIDAAAIAADAIGSSELAASAVTEIQAGLATAAALATVQADTDDIQTRLPAALVSGRMDASVGAMAANVLTAAATAADFQAEVLATVTGTTDSGSTTTIVDAERTEADTDYWKDSIVEPTSGPNLGIKRRISAFNAATDTITVDTAWPQAMAVGHTYRILSTAMQLAAAAGATDWSSTEKEHIRHRLGVDGTASAPTATPSLATAAAVATVQSDTDNIQTRLPAGLVSGRIDASVGAMAADVVTASAMATDAIGAAEFSQAAADKVWSSATRSLTDKVGFALSAAGIQAIWDALTSALTTVGSIGKRLVDFITGDAFVRLGAPAGASVSADVAAVQADTNDLQVRLPAALTAGGRMKASMEAIVDNADGPAALDRSARTIVRGTAGAGATTTSIPTSSLVPAAAVADQFKGRIVIFDKDTATAGLRGQATEITANTSGGTLTVVALTTAPASGDTFAIV